VLYFAYGSNMSISRLRQRAPSASRVGVCTLQYHDLRYHKKSADGSGKCDAYQTGKPNDFIIGSLFTIEPREKPLLDSAEGLGAGYEEKQVSLVIDSGKSVVAVMYYATAIDETLRPYSWYLQHVIIGANESKCLSSYVRRIKATETIKDEDWERDARERAIHDLVT
jgi:gamma-glutamylcyclotransferase